MKNEELVENLQHNKSTELGIIEAHYLNLIDNQNIFQQELQQDKKNLLVWRLTAYDKSPSP